MTLFAIVLAIVLVVLLVIAKKRGTINDPVRYFFQTSAAFFVGMWNVVVAVFRKVSGR